MLYFTKNKGDCTGCSACMSVCPVDCIKMRKDSEGFFYPVASDACINCGKCQKVCPIENTGNNIETSFEQTAYCALTKNNAIWQRSTSGGAFSEICRAFGETNALFCGAAWDGLKVHHICVEGGDSIAPLCKSKYIESSIEKVFLEIKSSLINGKKVVFCGTPCQVAGLKSFLKKDYNTLLTIDLICHGVGSPDVFEACLEIIGEQLNSKVVEYEFRTKRKIYEADYIQKIKTSNGRQIIVQKDPYMQLFMSQDCLRPSCGANCRFRNRIRQGDLTIADFKGLTKVYPDLLGTKRNYSSIIVNTKKGASIIIKLKETMFVRECNLEQIKEYNPLFCRQTYVSKNRDAFFNEFIDKGNIAIKKWTKPAIIYKESLKGKIFNILPVAMRKIYLKKRK